MRAEAKIYDRVDNGCRAFALPSLGRGSAVIRQGCQSLERRRRNQKLDRIYVTAARERMYLDGLASAGKAKLFQNVARGRVVEKVARRDGFCVQLFKAKIDDGRGSFRRNALPACVFANPIAKVKDPRARFFEAGTGDDFRRFEIPH